MALYELRDKEFLKLQRVQNTGELLPRLLSQPCQIQFIRLLVGCLPVAEILADALCRLGGDVLHTFFGFFGQRT